MPAGRPRKLLRCREMPGSVEVASAALPVIEYNDLSTFYVRTRGERGSVAGFSAEMVARLNDLGWPTSLPAIIHSICENYIASRISGPPVQAAIWSLVL